MSTYGSDYVIQINPYAAALKHTVLCALFDCSAMKSEARSPSPDDVIVLSDETPSPQTNGGTHVRELDADLLMVNT